MARIIDEPDKAPTRPLDQRYAYVRRIRGTHRTIIWVARDLRTGERVVVSIVPGPRAAALEPALDVEPPHLARLIAILDSPEASQVPSDEPFTPGSRVAIAAYVEGRTLEERLSAGPLPAALAVDWVATISDVLAALHERAAAHGAVSPKAVLVARPDLGEVPILGQLMAPPNGAYCSPERVTGGGPSEADDTWALAAVLYTALARRAPFHGATRNELARAIVLESPPPLTHLDPELWSILRRALSKDLRQRFQSAATFGAALRDWLDRAGSSEADDFAPVAAVVGPPMGPSYAVGDQSIVAAFARPDAPEALLPIATERGTDVEGPGLAEPAARGSSSAPPSALSRDAASRLVPRKPRHPLAFWSTVALAAIISAGLGVLAGRLRHPIAVREPAEAEAPVAGTPSQPTPRESAPTSPSAAGAKPASECVRDAFAEGTFAATPSFDFLCTESELWSVTRQMNVQMTHHARGEGLLTWERLGRFDLAGTAVLRERCCPSAKPFTVATPKGVCDSLEASVESVGREPTAEHVDRYAHAVDCLLLHQVKYPTEWWDRVGPRDARATFNGFLERLQP